MALYLFFHDSELVQIFLTQLHYITKKTILAEQNRIVYISVAKVVLKF